MTNDDNGKFCAALYFGAQPYDYFTSDDPYEIEDWVRHRASPVIVDDARYDGEGDYLHGSIKWGLTREMMPWLLDTAVQV